MMRFTNRSSAARPATFQHLAGAVSLLACITLLATPGCTPVGTGPDGDDTHPTSGTTVAHYELRVDVSTDSDWAILDFDGLSYLAWTKLSAEPGGSFCNYTGEHVSLFREDANCADPCTMAITLTYAVPETPESPSCTITSQKGDIGSTSILFTSTDADGHSATQSILHEGTVEDSDGTNETTFSVNLNQLLIGTPATGDIAPDPVAEPMLWAFYYPWYTLESWEADTLKDAPSVPYTSGDPEAIDRHITQAIGAGIDGFISSWWGPDDTTDANFRLLLDSAEEHDFSVCLYFETLAGVDDTPLDGSTIESWLEYAIDTYGQAPAYMRWEDRPVIFLWASDAVSIETWADVIARLKSRGRSAFYVGYGFDGSLDVFDALHVYGIAQANDVAALMQFGADRAAYHTLVGDDSVQRLSIATVQPGYDDTLLPGRDGFVQDRQQGQVYLETWSQATAAQPDWILITSWNEWWEHTHIEPSIDHGETHLQQTRTAVDEWKGRGTSP